MQNIGRTSPREFMSAFVEGTSSKLHDLEAYWFSDYRQYTQVMREHVFLEVAQKLDLNAYPGDYYTLDSIFYRERDTLHFGEHATYARHIEVAIEHENEIRGSE